LNEAVTLNYVSFITPGVIGMTIIFTCLYVGQKIKLDRNFGLMKVIMVSPMQRSHILIGLTLSNLTKALIQMILVMLSGCIVGVQFFKGFTVIDALVSILGILVFAVLFAFSLIFISTSIAMKVNNHETVHALTALLGMPLFFTSTALYPLESIPTILRTITYINPLAYFITGVRYFLLGSSFNFQGASYSYEISQVLISLGFLFVFSLVTFLIALKIFNNAKDF
jgi:ABC-2 type transport system permease protein